MARQRQSSGGWRSETFSGACRQGQARLPRAKSAFRLVAIGLRCDRAAECARGLLFRPKMPANHFPRTRRATIHFIDLHQVVDFADALARGLRNRPFSSANGSSFFFGLSAARLFTVQFHLCPAPSSRQEAVSVVKSSGIRASVFCLVYNAKPLAEKLVELGEAAAQSRAPISGRGRGKLAIS